MLGASGGFNSLALDGLLVEEVGIEEEGRRGDDCDEEHYGKSPVLILSPSSYSSEQLIKYSVVLH